MKWRDGTGGGAVCRHSELFHFLTAGQYEFRNFFGDGVFDK